MQVRRLLALLELVQDFAFLTGARERVPVIGKPLLPLLDLDDGVTPGALEALDERLVCEMILAGQRHVLHAGALLHAAHVHEREPEQNRDTDELLEALRELEEWRLLGDDPCDVKEQIKDLEKQVSEKEKEVEALEDQNMKLSDEVESLKDQVDDLEEEIRNLGDA